MSDLGDKLKELRGSQSQREMADPLGIKYQQWAKYERGEVAPGADMLKQICLVHACSADWLLGLDGGSGGQRATASGAGAIAVVGANATVSAGRPGTPPAVPADCSKCRLMQAHLREITGRG